MRVHSTTTHVALTVALTVAPLFASTGVLAQGDPATPALGSSLSYRDLLTLADAAPAVAAAAQALERAQREAAIAAAPVDLALSAGYDATWGIREPGGGAASIDLDDGNVAPIGVTVRVDALPFGPGADTRARATDAVLAAHDELNATMRRSRIDAVAAFQDGLLATAKLALARAEALLVQREAGALDQSRNAGAASDLAVAEAELRVARADQAVAAAERELNMARRTLATLLGRELPAPSGPLPELPTLPELTELASEAGGEVRSAIRESVDAERNADAAIRDFLPTLSVDATYRAGNEARSFSLGASLDSARLAPTLDVRFDPDDGIPGTTADGASLSSFEIGVRLDVVLDPALGDALEVVRLGREAAREGLASARAQAELALERAWVAAQDAAERLELARRASELAQRTVEVERLRHQAGAASESSLLRAELEERRSALDLEAARHTYRLSVFRLLDAAGAPPETLE